MWPQTLQISRDECRGILRRLELESYSQVISVFRAQGGLSDIKLKLLEDLRSVFHISQERHRAEARRVANDEQLATIAEAISGPNTWQEWSREGRRPYPLLPRLAPQTALAVLAKSVVEEVEAENDHLPYPAETGQATMGDVIRVSQEHEFLTPKSNYVVTEDPFKVPDIPKTSKKSLKRSINDKRNIDNKKRVSNVQVSIKNQTAQRNGINTKKRHLSLSKQNRQQQNENEQKIKSKVSSKKSTNSTNSSNVKRQKTLSKTGRRKQKVLEHQVEMHPSSISLELEQKNNQQQLTFMQNAESHQLKQQADNIVISPQNSVSPELTTSIQRQRHFQLSQRQQLHNVVETQLHPYGQELESVKQDSIVVSKEFIESSPKVLMSYTGPQIVSSKRDITKNLNKLHLQNQNQYIQPKQPLNAILNSSHGMTTTGVGNNMAPLKLEKSLICTTPVQKYIVEERKPQITESNSVALFNLPSQLQRSNSGPTNQNLLQFSSATTKLQHVSNSLPVPTKLETPVFRKLSSPIANVLTGISGCNNATTHLQTSINAAALHELANVATSQSQVSSAIEPKSPVNLNSNHNNSINNLITPMHTPPAVLQLRSLSSNGNSSSTIQNNLQSQTKIPPNKVLPIVLTGGSHQAINGPNYTAVPMVPAVSTSVNTTIMKTLPSTLVLCSTNSSNSNFVRIPSTSIISTVGNSTNATLFRRPSNILKPSITTSMVSDNSNTSHILNNIKFLPINSTSQDGSTIATIVNNTKGMRDPTTTGIIRKNIKICQSPNGKMFIQPTNIMDGSKIKLSSNITPQRIISTDLLRTSTNMLPSNTTSNQRIAIQKVQIIPSLTSSGSSSNMDANNQFTTATTVSPASTLSKSNRIIMPCSTASNVRSVSISQLIKANSNILPGEAIPLTSSNSRLVVLDNVSSIKKNLSGVANLTTQNNSSAIPITVTTTNSAKMDNNRLLNEDAPLDILNMPIVMDAGVLDDESSTVTIFENNMENVVPIQILSNNPFPVKTNQNLNLIHMNATDWEMELDHSITTVASLNKDNNESNLINTTVVPKNQIINTTPSQTFAITRNNPGTTTSTKAALSCKSIRSAGSIVCSNPTDNSIVITTINSTSNTPSHVLTNLSDIKTRFNIVAATVPRYDGTKVMKSIRTSNNLNALQTIMSPSNITNTNNKNLTTVYVDGNNERVLEDFIIVERDALSGEYRPITSMRDKVSDAKRFVVTGRRSLGYSDIVRPKLMLQSMASKPPTTLMKSSSISKQPENDVDAGFDETIVTEVDENPTFKYNEKISSESKVVTQILTQQMANRNVETTLMENTIMSANDTATTITTVFSGISNANIDRLIPERNIIKVHTIPQNTKTSKEILMLRNIDIDPGIQAIKAKTINFRKAETIMSRHPGTIEMSTLVPKTATITSISSDNDVHTPPLSEIFDYKLDKGDLSAEP